MDIIIMKKHLYTCTWHMATQSYCTHVHDIQAHNLHNSIRDTSDPLVSQAWPFWRRTSGCVMSPIRFKGDWSIGVYYTRLNTLIHDR